MFFNLRQPLFTTINLHLTKFFSLTQFPSSYNYLLPTIFNFKYFNPFLSLPFFTQPHFIFSIFYHSQSSNHLTLRIFHLFQPIIYFSRSLYLMNLSLNFTIVFLKKNFLLFQNFIFIINKIKILTFNLKFFFILFFFKRYIEYNYNFLNL